MMVDNNSCSIEWKLMIRFNNFAQCRTSDAAAAFNSSVSFLRINDPKPFLPRNYQAGTILLLPESTLSGRLESLPI